jgi:hypothetical protein
MMRALHAAVGATVPIGDGQALLVSGRIEPPPTRIRVRLDADPQRVRFAAGELCAVVPLGRERAGEQLVLSVEADDVTLLERRFVAVARVAVAPVAEAPVVICLATCDPEPQRLEALLASLEAQTRRDWMCIVADDASSPERLAWLERRLDARYRLVRGEERVGFYRNFERALERVGPGARFVALCDQDDVWHPEKLARSIATLEASGAQLVACARRIVDERGQVREIAPAPSVRDPALLLVENAVAGAASLFRRELLDRALPFPPDHGGFHDHWLACVAAHAGGIAALDEPLLDYVQHAGNVIGHRPPASGALSRALSLLAAPRRWPQAIAEARLTVARELPRLALYATVLELRFPEARLRAFAGASALGLAAIEARALYAGEAAGIAGQLALGLLAERIASSHALPRS